MLNSEYRNRFKWHDTPGATYQAPIQETVRRTEMSICSEPALPRRKKHPEFAYRTHEVFGMVNGCGDSSDSLEAETLTNRDQDNRARSEVRNFPSGNRTSPRSKSVDPFFGRRRPMSAYISSAGKGVVRSTLTSSTNPVEPAEQRHPTSAAIPGIDQFMWPTTALWMLGKHGDTTPRKSISMGAIQAAGGTAKTIAHAHTATTGTATRNERRHVKLPADRGLWEGAVKSSEPEEPTIVAKRIAHGENVLEATATMASQKGAGHSSVGRSERRHVKVVSDKGLWDGAVKNVASEDQTISAANHETVPRKIKTEYKSQFKAPAKYAYVEGTWKKMSRSADSEELQLEEPTSLPWYGEVVELRKKAGEYKYRSLGSNIAPDQLAELYSRQEVYEQLTSRSNLSALALATTPSSWKKATHKAGGNDTPRSLQSSVRHHLERTTPAPGETGFLIMSPTRDHKLEPVDVKKSDRDANVSPSKTKPTSSKVSSKSGEKNVASKGTSSGAPPSVTNAQSRSASAGTVHRSPKRTPRPVSMIVPGSKAQVNGVPDGSGDSVAQRKIEVKRPRPTTLTTSSTTTTHPKTVPSIRAGKVVHAEEGVPKVHGAEGRSRPPSAPGISAPVSRHPPHSAPAGATPAAHTLVTAPAISSRPITSSSKPVSVIAPTVHTKPAPGRIRVVSPVSAPHPLTADAKSAVMVNGDDTGFGKINKDDVVENGGDPDGSKEIEETLMMKSPPEPTRVKSPEQILVRSPEPVKWTIPLETGIKWTGTPKTDGDGLKVSSYGHPTPPSVASPVESPTSTHGSQDAEVLVSELEKSLTILNDSYDNGLE